MDRKEVIARAKANPRTAKNAFLSAHGERSLLDKPDARLDCGCDGKNRFHPGSPAQQRN
jgi:hypothetical protein